MAEATEGRIVAPGWDQCCPALGPTLIIPIPLHGRGTLKCVVPMMFYFLLGVTG